VACLHHPLRSIPLEIIFYFLKETFFTGGDTTHSRKVLTATNKGKGIQMKTGKVFSTCVLASLIATAISLSTSNAQTPHWDNEPSVTYGDDGPPAYFSSKSVAVGNDLYTLGPNAFYYGNYLWRWSKCCGWKEIQFLGDSSGTWFNPTSMAVHGNYIYLAGQESDGYGGVKRYDVVNDQWTDLGYPAGNVTVYAITVDAAGNVYTSSYSYPQKSGGEFDPFFLMKYNGTSWTSVTDASGKGLVASGSGPSSVVLANDGINVFVAGSMIRGFVDDPYPHNLPDYPGPIVVSFGVVGWNPTGTRWIDMGGLFANDAGTDISYLELPYSVTAMACINNDVFVAGDFNHTTVQHKSVTVPPGTIAYPIFHAEIMNHLARFHLEPNGDVNSITTFGFWLHDPPYYDPTGIISYPTTTVGYVNDLAVHDGVLYAAGNFLFAGMVPANNIAKLSNFNISFWLGIGLVGEEFSPVGSGIGNPNATVTSLASANNAVYAGGSFNVAGGVNFPSSQSMARWMTGYDPADAPAGLISWWKAQNDTTDAINLNNGIAHGSVSYTAGKVGQAFNLNGSSYIEVPSNPSIAPSGSFSIETWVNFTSLNASGGDCIIAKGNDCNCIGDWALFIMPSGKLRPHVNINGWWYYFDCSTTLAPNTWYHVAMVYDGSYIRGYVNGTLDGQQAASGTVATSTQPLKIGVYSPSLSYAYFRGAIDELTFYKTALSASQIQGIFNAGAYGKCMPKYSCTTASPNLVGWWKGDDSAVDQTQTANGIEHGSVAYASGRVGDAFNLNGSSYVEVPDVPALEPSGPFAVESWVKFTSLNAVGGNCIVAKGNDCNCIGDWGLFITPTGKLRPHIKINNRWVFFDCNSTLKPNTWYHVGMVYNGSQVIGYVDGANDGQATASGPVGTSNQPMKIGVYSPSLSYCYFHGLIDEVSVYNGSLSPAEIAAIFGANTAGKCQ
jgi:Concanavalin A-like lectin/glucanases superfamily